MYICEQHEFQLYRSTFKCGFLFNKYILKCYKIHIWLHPWMENHRSWGPTVKLDMDFQLCTGSLPLTLKDQEYFLLKLPLNLIYKLFQKTSQYFHHNSFIQFISPLSFTIHTKRPKTTFKFKKQKFLSALERIQSKWGRF